MLLSAQNIKKEYGIQQILDIGHLEIGDGDRIGLIGPNGAGKSTLLSILAGDLPPDSGTVRRFCPIAQIRQSGQAQGEADPDMMSRFGLWQSPLKSGGERTRIAIGAAFSQRAPLLFADEPTTSLDLEGRILLEKMLAGYRGAIVLVSHDRALLERICTRIWEIDSGSLRVFEGRYSQWAAQREREQRFKTEEYEQYIRERNRLRRLSHDLQSQGEAMKRPPRRMGSSEWLLYKGTASIQQGHVHGRAAAVKSRLEHLEKKERPNSPPRVSMKIEASANIRAPYAARIRGLTVSHSGAPILCDASLFVRSGIRTVITGSNGAGKSTLLQSLIARAPGVSVPAEARIAYFSQEQDTLKPGQSLLANVTEGAAYPEHICRAVLANLCLKASDLEKPVRVLSGGERVKAALAKVLVSGCSFLILDEPTNHMDIYTMEGLERLLSSYNGTLLAVSHDRAFIRAIAQEVYEVRDGKIYPKPLISV